MVALSVGVACVMRMWVEAMRASASDDAGAWVSQTMRALEDEDTQLFPTLHQRRDQKVKTSEP